MSSAPPFLAVLLVKVQFVAVSGPLLMIAPPLFVAEFNASVQLVSVSVPTFWMAPPASSAWFSRNWHPVSVSVPVVSLKIAPPKVVVELPVKVQFVSVSVP